MAKKKLHVLFITFPQGSARPGKTVLRKLGAKKFKAVARGLVTSTRSKWACSKRQSKRGLTFLTRGKKKARRVDYVCIK